MRVFFFLLFFSSCVCFVRFLFFALFVFFGRTLSRNTVAAVVGGIDVSRERGYVLYRFGFIAFLL